MGHNDGKITLYALAKKPSSNLRNRLQNFSKEQKMDPALQQKITEIKVKKTTKYEVHDDLLYFISGENKRLCLTKGIIYDLIDECH